MYSGGAMIDEIQAQTLMTTSIPKSISPKTIPPTTIPPTTIPPTTIPPTTIPPTTIPPISSNVATDRRKETSSDVATDGSETIAERTNESPTVKENTLPTIDVVRPAPPMPTPSQKKEAYAAEYLLLFIIYVSIALIYMIHSGVNIPSTSLNNWMLQNPHYMNMMLSTLYFSLSIVYLLYFHPENGHQYENMFKSCIAITVSAVTLMGWYKLYKKHSTTTQSSYFG